MRLVPVFTFSSPIGDGCCTPSLTPNVDRSCHAEYPGGGPSPISDLVPNFVIEYGAGSGGRLPESGCGS